MDGQTGYGVVVSCRVCHPTATATCERCLVTGWADGSGVVIQLDEPEQRAVAALLAAGLVPLTRRERPRALALAGA